MQKICEKAIKQRRMSDNTREKNRMKITCCGDGREKRVYLMQRSLTDEARLDPTYPPTTELNDIASRMMKIPWPNSQFQTRPLWKFDDWNCPKLRKTMKSKNM